MDISINNALQQFLVCQEIKGNTFKTVDNYKCYITYFMNFFGSERMVSEISVPVLNEYLLYLKKKPKFQGHPFRVETNQKKSTVTIQSYTRQLRVFLNWLHSEGYMQEKLTDRFKLPKAEKKTIEILSAEEIEILFSLYNPKCELGLRNTIILSLMLDCGLRRNEVISLEYDRVHFSQNVLAVQGKGQKERIVPFGLMTKRYLMRYMNGLRSLPAIDTKRLLISKDKMPLTVDSVKMLFERMKRKTEITRLKPHLLRHTFATYFLINGGDMFQLQLILGHESLNMVRKYVHLASSFIVADFKKRSPLDGFMKSKYERCS